MNQEFGRRGIMADIVAKKKRECTTEDLSMDHEEENGFHHHNHRSHFDERNRRGSRGDGGQRNNNYEKVKTSPQKGNESSSDIPEERLFVYQYSVVKTLFEKLPIRDLLACAQVCKMWSEVARVVRKQRRNHPSLMLYHPYLPYTKPVVEWFNGQLGHNLSETAKEFVETQILAPIKDTLDGHFTMYPEVSEQIRPAVLEWINRSYYEPQLVIFFGSPTLNSYMSKRCKIQYLYQSFAGPVDMATNVSLILFSYSTATVYSASAFIRRHRTLRTKYCSLRNWTDHDCDGTQRSIHS